MGEKRQREDRKPADGSASERQPGSGGKATIGQQTSHIKNKLVRAELYGKLKHKQKVSAAVALLSASYKHLLCQPGLVLVCSSITACSAAARAHHVLAVDVI
jgi:hypothetical protein